MDGEKIGGSEIRTILCGPGALEAALGALPTEPADPAAATEAASLLESGGSLLDMFSRDSRQNLPAFHESEQNGNQTVPSVVGDTTPAYGDTLHGSLSGFWVFFIFYFLKY